MKKIIVSLFFVFFLFLACENDSNMFKVRGYGYVHLTVKDENGKPFKYKDAKRFKLQYPKMFESLESSVVINEKDDLIFSLERVEITYHDYKRLKAKEGFTDEEIVAGLNRGQSFSLRDTQDEYCTIEYMLYKDAYVSFSRTKWKVSLDLSEPTHIYNCEVTLKKK